MTDTLSTRDYGVMAKVSIVINKVEKYKRLYSEGRTPIGSEIVMFSLDLSSSHRVVSHGLFIRLFENVGKSLKLAISDSSLCFHVFELRTKLASVVSLPRQNGVGLFLI